MKPILRCITTAFLFASLLCLLNSDDHTGLAMLYSAVCIMMVLIHTK